MRTIATGRNSLQAIANKNYFANFVAISCDPSGARLGEFLKISLTLIGFHPLAPKCIRLQKISSLKPGRPKKVLDSRILLPRKTDNPYVSKEKHSDPETSIRPENEPYASFLRRIDEISGWLGSGYSVKGVWIACTRSTPAFSGSYHTFWRYCRLHDLRVRRGASPRASRESTAPLGAAPKVPEAGGASSQKIWPRLQGKPREFIPRTEGDE